MLGLISRAKNLKICSEHFWAPRNPQFITSVSSVQHSLLWQTEGERADGKGSVTYCCLSLEPGTSKPHLLRGKTKDKGQWSPYDKWHQKSPMLRWSSRMHHQLQWSKVRNGWVIQGKGTWRERGWRTGKRDFSFCDSGSYLVLTNWWEKGVVYHYMSRRLEEFWSKRVKEHQQEDRWESLGGWSFNMNKDDYWEHKL